MFGKAQAYTASRNNDNYYGTAGVPNTDTHEKLLKK